VNDKTPVCQSEHSEIKEAQSSAIYPLLTALLRDQGLPLKGKYSTRDVANIFEVTARAIQERMHDGRLPYRDLPGSSRFLAADLEEYLRGSRQDRQKDKAKRMTSR
jgi:hypothetical protein